MSRTSIDQQIDTSQQRAPLAVRLAVLFGVGLLAAGALALVLIRGDIILLDLASLGARIWCF